MPQESVLRFTPEGANPAPQLIGANQLPGTVNYFLGNDPSQWHTAIPTFGGVTYQAIYPGIDLSYSGTNGHVESTYVITPGADLSAIQLSVDGVQGLSIDAAGDLVLQTPLGPVTQTAPLASQGTGDDALSLPCQYVVLGPHTYGFSVGAYNAQEPLIIDPVISYSTYLGGGGFDWGVAIAVDSAGSAYVTGATESTDFPTTTTAYSTTFVGQRNAFVSKLNPSGTALLYSSYLGGRGSGSASTGGYGIGVDAAGNAYVTGYTNSNDFPMTPGVVQPQSQGGLDAFLTKVISTGTGLAYSTYLGGGDYDTGNAVAVASSGVAYVVGTTYSSNFPTTTVFGPPPSSNSGKAFVTAVNLNATAFVYSITLGGSGREHGGGVALDAAGDAYVTGDTSSSSFPTTTNVLKISCPNCGKNLNGFTGTNAFVTEINPAGTSLVYSTYLGGSTADAGWAIAVDKLGNVAVTGPTRSTDFPTTPDAFQGAAPVKNGSYNPADIFVSKINGTGTGLVYSTYLGGNDDETGIGMAMDPLGYASVTGYTCSTNFPVVNAVQIQPGGACDDFVTRFDPAGRVAYSTYFGGPTYDEADGIAVDGAGNSYVTGQTDSTGFPTVHPLQGRYGGGSADAVVFKIIPAGGGQGTVPWHPHHTVRFSDGLSASVDLADGHVDVSAAGMSIPARGPNLTMGSTWDSTLARQGVTTLAGRGWTSDLTQSLSGVLTGTMVYSDATGAIWPFIYTGSVTATAPYTAYVTPPGLPWQLTTSSSGYTLTNILSGAIRVFDSGGRYVSDTDAYGNSNTLTYTSTASMPVTETNSGGPSGQGRALSFYYGTNGLLTAVQSPLDRATGNVQGQLVAYGYSPTTGQLTSLIRGYASTAPVTTSFAYSGTQMTQVTTGGGHSWYLGYDGLGRLNLIINYSAGTPGQTGYTPAYATLVTYSLTQTQVVQGVGTSGALPMTYTLDSQGQPLTVTDGLGHSDQYTYDGEHNVLTHTDANQHTTTNTYQYVGPAGTSGVGSVGLVTQTVLPPIQPFTFTNSFSPVVITHTYDAHTYDLLETDNVSQGSITRYLYNGQHSVVTTTQLLDQGCPPPTRGMLARPRLAGAAHPRRGTRGIRPYVVCQTPYTWRGQINSYDSYGQLSSVVDGRGVSVTADRVGTASLVGDPATVLSATHTFVYSVTGDLLSASTPPIVTQQHSMAVAGPVTTTYGYDFEGNATSMTSPNGTRTQATYDPLGRLVSHSQLGVALSVVATPVTVVQTVSYDGDSNVVRTVDGAGGVTTAYYDPLNRLVAQVNPVGATTLYTYSATALTQAQDGRGFVTRYGFDQAGQLISSTDPLSVTTQYAYDPVGNTTVITTPLSGGASTVETRGYDALNEVVTDTVSGSGEISPTVPLTTSTSYDLAGGVVQQVAPNGDGTYHTNDLAERTTQVTVAPAAVITAPTTTAGEYLTLDGVDNMVELVDFNQRAHQSTFDGANRLVQQVDSCASCLGASGLLTTTPLYDPDGNVLAQFQQSGGGTAVTAAVYNALDWLLASNDGPGTTTYGYDRAGRLLTQSLLGSTAAGVVTSTLDAAGREITVTESLAGMGGSTSRFGYNGNDQVVTATLPFSVTETVTETRSYDNNSRLSSLNTGLPSLNNTYSYAYNAPGWTTVVTSSVFNNNALREDVAHDAVGRVLTDTFSSSTGRQDVGSYDGNNNLLSWATVLQASGAVVDSTTYSYTYTTGITPTPWLPNELLSSTHTDAGGTVTTGYGYDPSGNTTSLTSTAGLSQTLDYDAAGRLSHVTTVNGSSQTRVSLGYNARGLRSSYVVTTTGQSQPTLSESLLYRGTLVGQVVVSGTNVSPAYTETFLYRQDGTPLELLRQVAGQAGTSRYDYLVDGRGTVVGLTDSNGAVQNSYTYTGLWGALDDLGSTESVPQPLRFAGYWYDGWAASAQAGDRLPWYWLQTRSYDPVLKRFLQPDPSSQDGVRSYVYAHDDPVDLVDPSGLESGCGSTNSEGGESSQACGNAASTVRGGAGTGGPGEVAPLNEPTAPNFVLVPSDEAPVPVLLVDAAGLVVSSEGVPRQTSASAQALANDVIDTEYRVLTDGIDPATALRDLVARQRPKNYAYAGTTYQLDDPALRAKYAQGVPFTELGFPDFSDYVYVENGARAEVQIQMQGNRDYGTTGDFANANEAAGFLRSRVGTPSGYTWHHVEDRMTMQLVPFDLHFNVAHSGGVWVINELGTLP